MKAANLLISNDGCLKIADFGLARAYDPNIIKDDGLTTKRKYTNVVVTRWYRPPELLLGARRYGGEVDMWGVGYVSSHLSILLAITVSQLCARRNVLPEADPAWRFGY